jgi:hypothetical protein
MWPDLETSWGTMIVRNLPKEVSFGIEDFRRLSWAGNNNPGRHLVLAQVWPRRADMQFRCLGQRVESVLEAAGLGQPEIPWLRSLIPQSVLWKKSTCGSMVVYGKQTNVSRRNARQ